MDPDLIRRILAAIAQGARTQLPHSGGARPITEVAPELGRGAVDFGTQALKGLGTTGARIPEGISRIIGEDDSAKFWEDTRTQLEDFYGPAKTGYGLPGEMFGTVAPAAAGLALGGTSLPGILAAGAAVDAPLEASSRDFSALGMVSDYLNQGEPSPIQYELNKLADKPRARGAVGTLLGGGLSLGAELFPATKAARAAEREAKAAAEKAAAARATAPLPPILKDADQKAIDRILEERRIAQIGAEDLPPLPPERPKRLESKIPQNELDVPTFISPVSGEAGAVDPLILREIARTGARTLGGAAVGGAAAGGEGGVTPLQGAGAGALLANVPSALRLLKRARGGAVEAVTEGVEAAGRAKNVAQHPTRISDLPPKVKDDYDVTISALAGTEEGVPEVVARAERIKPDLTPKYTRTRAQAEALAKDIPLEDVLAKPSNAPISDVEVAVLKTNFNANKAELDDLYAKQRTTIDAVEAEQIGTRIDELEAVQDQIMHKSVPTSSEIGRAMASLRGNFAAGSPAAWIQKSEKMVGRALTSAEKEEVNVLVKAGKHREASQYVEELLAPLTIKDIEFWTTFRKGSLLSSGVSIGRALFGNSANVAFNAASRPATVMLDAFASLLRSGSPLAARSTSVRGTGRQLWEGAKGAASGVPEGARIMLSGLDDAAAAKMELRKGNRLKSPVGFGVPESVRSRLPKGAAPKRVDIVDMWTQFWLRAQGAADRPFRNATIRASNAELAQLTARREGLRGAERKARINHLIANPTPEMGILSNLRADHISFQGESFLTDIGARLKTAASGSDKVGRRSVARNPLIRGTVEMVQPFTRTPGAIVQQNLEATPFGIFGAVSDAKKLARAVSKRDKKLADEIQRRMASRGGRAITGSVIGIWLGGKWYSEGKMKATAPEGGSDRTQFFDAGKTPFSVKVDGRWISLAQLGPLGAAVSFGAMLAKTAEEEDKTVRQLFDNPAAGLGTLGQGAVQTTAQLALETPFLTGTKEVLDALQDPNGSFGEKAINTAASFVPNLSASRARAVDPVVRSPEGLVETVKTRIPGQSQDVTPSLMAVSGQPKLRETPETKQGWWQAVLGSSPDRTKIEPILAEMESVGASAGRQNAYDGETDEQLFERRQITGDYVQSAILAFANPTPESAALLSELRLDTPIPDLGLPYNLRTLPDVYRTLKELGPNSQQAKDILLVLDEVVPGFPEAENAGDLLEHVISRARGFMTTRIKQARQSR